MHSMADLTLYGNDGTYDKNETKPATASLTTRIDDIGFGLGPAEPSLDLSSFLDGQSTPAVDELLEGFYFGGAAPPVPTPVALVTVAREFIDLPTIKVEPTDFSTQQRWKSFVDTEHSYYTSGASSSSCSPPRAAATPGPVAATPGLAAATPGTAAATPGPAPAAGGKKSASKKRAAPKGSVQYVERRERNNLAVRKSRQKSKQHNVAMGRRVQELAAHNHSLQTKVDQLTKELDMLKQLFSVAVKDGASAR
ncbi:PREDICTED: uncharacterized protein LOC106807810 isoform X2 [Priapulus caudatus]|uniref:Uncharacterized protein LOC106807810 isoform X2 n=1 Tax=Priapulus caudatus TaxID=37621 RepID=A0ABM1E0N4_PRICU|nr:PREDICTED: uncharacterized protein LOC106807810 isoform X2 [Priapulus caudatus]